MTEKAESLEQAARFLRERKAPAFKVYGPNLILSVREVEALMAEFADERERQVWAEAAKFTKHDASCAAKALRDYINDAKQVCACGLSALEEKYSARGEQVK